MDKNVIRRGEIVSDSGKLYSVIGVLGTVMYIQETDAGLPYKVRNCKPLIGACVFIYVLVPPGSTHK